MSFKNRYSSELIGVVLWTMTGACFFISIVYMILVTDGFVTGLLYLFLAIFSFFYALAVQVVTLICLFTLFILFILFIYLFILFYSFYLQFLKYHLFFTSFLSHLASLCTSQHTYTLYIPSYMITLFRIRFHLLLLYFKSHV